MSLVSLLLYMYPGGALVSLYCNYNYTCRCEMTTHNKYTNPSAKRYRSSNNIDHYVKLDANCKYYSYWSTSVFWAHIKLYTNSMQSDILTIIDHTTLLNCKKWHMSP